MVYEYPEITSAKARKLHPKASIIRHTQRATFVFDRTIDAVNHFTTPTPTPTPEAGDK